MVWFSKFAMHRNYASSGLWISRLIDAFGTQAITASPSVIIVNLFVKSSKFISYFFHLLLPNEYYSCFEQIGPEQVSEFQFELQTLHLQICSSLLFDISSTKSYKCFPCTLRWAPSIVTAAQTEDVQFSCQNRTYFSKDLDVLERPKVLQFFLEGMISDRFFSCARIVRSISKIILANSLIPACTSKIVR